MSIWHWLIVLAVVLLLFGGSSKISTLMGDFAKGIKSFKKNMGEDESMEAQAGGAPRPNIAPPQGVAHAPGQVAGAQPGQPYPPQTPYPQQSQVQPQAHPYPQSHQG